MEETSVNTGLERCPEIVRIKRKRDEPALSGFLLGAKRRPASISNLSVDTQLEVAVTRYRLVGTKVLTGGLFVPTALSAPPPQQPAADSAEARARAHQQSARALQSEARYRTVSLRRSSSIDGGVQQHVLELQRVPPVHKCASVPSLTRIDASATPTTPPPRPKLVPFGPPLPPQPQYAVSSGWRAPSTSSEPHGDIWADAAVAAALGEDARADAAAAAALGEDGATQSTDVEPSSSVADLGDFVYDEYSLAAPEEASSGTDGLWGELWWEELDADAVRELEEADDAEGSDSGDEVDYPDEEDSDDDEEEEAWRPGGREYF